MLIQSNRTNYIEWTRYISSNSPKSVTLYHIQMCSCISNTKLTMFEFASESVSWKYTIYTWIISINGKLQTYSYYLLNGLHKIWSFHYIIISIHGLCNEFLLKMFKCLRLLITLIIQFLFKYHKTTLKNNNIKTK